MALQADGAVKQQQAVETTNGLEPAAESEALYMSALSPLLCLLGLCLRLEHPEAEDSL